MLKNVSQLKGEVGKFVSYWHLDTETPIEIAEQMCLQFLNYFGKVKEAHAAAALKLVQESAPMESQASVEEQPKE